MPDEIQLSSAFRNRFYTLRFEKVEGDLGHESDQLWNDEKERANVIHWAL